MYSNSLLITLIGVCFMFVSCKKKKSEDTEMLNAKVYGMYKAGNVFSTASSLHAWGAIEPANATHIQRSEIEIEGEYNQGAYNPTNKSYYILKNAQNFGKITLVKLSATGEVESFIYKGTYTMFYGLVYNPVFNKLYCFKVAIRSGVSSSKSIVELDTKDSSLTLPSEIPIVKKEDASSDISSTVDPNSGDLFFARRDRVYNECIIDRWNPGTRSSTIVIADSGNYTAFYGLQYNRTDHWLYAIREQRNYPSSTRTYTFVRVDPATSTMTTLATLPFSINVEFYSTAVDPETNHYLLSTEDGNGGSMFVHIDMNGTVVQQTATSGLFGGMATKW